MSITAEGLAAGYTVDEPDGSQWIMACAIYCACKADNNITVDRVYNAFTGLLTGYTIPSLDNLDNWLSTLIGVDDNDPLICYALFSLLWGIARKSSFFGNVRLSDATFKLIVKEGSLDLSHNPSDFCFDCDGWCISLTVSNGALQSVFTPSGGAGYQSQWNSGWEHSPSFISRITIHGNLGGTFSITGMKVIMDSDIGGGALNAVVIFTSGFASALNSDTPGTAITDHSFTASLSQFEIDVEGDTSATGPYDVTSKIIEIQIRGTGTVPILGDFC